MDMDYTMPPAIIDSPDAEEERRRRAAVASGLTMPPAVTPGSAAQPRLDSSSTMTMPSAVPPATTRSNASAEAPTIPPAFYSGVNARPQQPTTSAMPSAGYADQYKEIAAQEPNRADYPAQPMPWWKKALGLVSAAAGGLGRKDETTYHLASDVLNAPEANAQSKFEQARKAWQEKLGGVEKESGLANTASEISERDARTQQLLHPQTKEQQPPKIAYHYTNDQGQEVSVFEDGTEKVGGKTQPKPPASDTNKVAPEIEAQIGALPKADPKNPTAPVQWNGKTYPSERAAQQAWGKAAEKIKNGEAMAGREVLNQGKAVNIIRDGQLLAIHPDSLQPGDVLAGAGAGMATMSKEGQFNEIHTGIDSARSAITNLDKPFSAGQIGKLTLAMRHSNDPEVFKTEIETILGSQELTPAQQDFVIAIGQLNER